MLRKHGVAAMIVLASAAALISIAAVAVSRTANPRLLEDDLRSSAIVVAHLAYELAMREQPLPRFDRRSMPSGTWR